MGKKIRIYSLFKGKGCNLKKLYANSLYMEVCPSLTVPLFIVQHVLYECRVQCPFYCVVCEDQVEDNWHIFFIAKLVQKAVILQDWRTLCGIGKRGFLWLIK